MSTDLVEFIEARLAEDEHAARAAGWHHWTIVDNEIATIGNGRLVVRLERDYDGPHIVRHDPARVLREVEAKRQLLALHPHARYVNPLDAASIHEEDHRPAFDDSPRYVGCATCHYDYRYEENYPSWWCDTVRLLALPYAGHPDYRSEWSPA